MGGILVLDCTLRDGGYCNEWKFGEKNIKKIVNGLVEAGIDIIECGFLTNRVAYNAEVTKYTQIQEVSRMIPQNRQGKEFVCMVNYGEYNLEDIPEYDGTSIDGLRVAFHKKDMIEALKFAKGIKKKGYKVFIQAMVSLSYSDEEFLDLINRVNAFEPYAFYIVDSFGVMKRNDLQRLFYLVEHNLKQGICIGFHSHNNMQLAYSNAQTLVDTRTSRELIIDSSVYGMGRGAGNLNTELFVDYLNNIFETGYILKPLLAIIDETLSYFHQKNYWGYTLPNYLSAKHNAHPNYAGYLDEKKTLTVENMDDIFSMMEKEKRFVFDKAYIEDLYLKYMATGRVQEERYAELVNIISGREVLIIAPGKSSRDEKDKVIQCAQRKNVITIAINFDYPEFATDFIFLSNLRRFRKLAIDKREKCIITSNIPSVDAYLQTKYSSLLNEYEGVQDNAGMMLIKFLIQLNAGKIYVAGIDGYSMDSSQNFADPQMNFYTQKAMLETMNKGMNLALKAFSTKIHIEFVTTPKYVNI